MFLSEGFIILFSSNMTSATEISITGCLPQSDCCSSRFCMVLSQCKLPGFWFVLGQLELLASLGSGHACRLWSGAELTLLASLGSPKLTMIAANMGNVGTCYSQRSIAKMSIKNSEYLLCSFDTAIPYYARHSSMP